MTYTNSADFRRALQHRLRNEVALRPGYTVQRIRKQLVFERFAARLAHIQPNGWIAKGGAVLEFRLRERARTTQDIDLAAEFDAETVAELMLKAAALDLGDWFSFRMERVRALQDDDGVLAVRFRLTGSLMGIDSRSCRSTSVLGLHFHLNQISFRNHRLWSSLVWRR